MRVLLVRHGESQANVNRDVYKIIPDHEIALSLRGIEQAERVAEILKAYFEKEYVELFDSNLTTQEKANVSIKNMTKSANLNDDVAKVFQGILSRFGNISENEIKPKIRLYYSPYKRTRETAKIITDLMGDMLLDSKEDILLSELRRGLFDGIDEKEQEKLFPNEFKHFNHIKQHSGKFLTRYPMGDSSFDCFLRLRQFFNRLDKDEEEGVQDVIIVCHGTILKLFTMAWLNKTPEWFVSEESPGNCAVRILNKSVDCGYLIGGFKDGKAWEHKINAK